MIRKVLYATLATMALSVGAARAEDTIVWWDFLSGGDGVRMKAMLEEFNKEHAGKVKIDATTSEWGTPFYTKVQTAAATGQGPDVMTYHESRMPLGVSEGVLSPLTPEELAAAGIKASDFSPANWKAAQGPDGKQYAVPLDIHSIILYYNKDLLKKAGLLGDDGKPKGLDGAANFDAALAKLTANGVVRPFGAERRRLRLADLLHSAQPAGRPVPEGRQVPRWGQSRQGDDRARRDAEVDQEQMRRPTNTEYPASIALFTSGKAAMHINGVWEVPTMVDLAKKGQLFDWGAIQIPVLYAQPATWADSHSFAIPDRKGNPVDPAKRKLVLDAIHWFNDAFARMGGRRPCPGLSAGAGERGVQGDEAELRLRLARQDGGLRSGFDLRRRRLARLRRVGQLRDARAERRDRACRRREEDARRPAGPDEMMASTHFAPRSGRFLKAAGAALRSCEAVPSR